MWNPGTLVHLKREHGNILTPPIWKLDKALLCIVLSAREVGFGTKGATYSYVMLSHDTRILSLTIKACNADKFFVVHREM